MPQTSPSFSQRHQNAGTELTTPQGPRIYALSVGHPLLAGSFPDTRPYQVEFTTAAVAAVPEPSTATLLLCAAALLWLGSRTVRNRPSRAKPV